MVIDEGREPRQEVPFDMSKETLKSIRTWIDRITELSVGMIGGLKVNLNDMILFKHDMVRQLIVLASPLLGKDLDETETYFSEIKIKRGDVKTSEGWSRNIKIYSLDVDNDLDECVKGIQKILKKYFVPVFNEGEKY